MKRSLVTTYTLSATPAALASLLLDSCISHSLQRARPPAFCFQSWDATAASAARQSQQHHPLMIAQVSELFLGVSAYGDACLDYYIWARSFYKLLQHHEVAITLGG